MFVTISICLPIADDRGVCVCFYLRGQQKAANGVTCHGIVGKAIQIRLRAWT